MSSAINTVKSHFRQGHRGEEQNRTYVPVRVFSDAFKLEVAAEKGKVNLKAPMLIDTSELDKQISSKKAGIAIWNSKKTDLEAKTNELLGRILSDEGAPDPSKEGYNEYNWALQDIAQCRVMISSLEAEVAELEKKKAALLSSH